MSRLMRGQALALGPGKQACMHGGGGPSSSTPCSSGEGGADTEGEVGCLAEKRWCLGGGSMRSRAELCPQSRHLPQTWK